MAEPHTRVADLMARLLMEPRPVVEDDVDAEINRRLLALLDVELGPAKPESPSAGR